MRAILFGLLAAAWVPAAAAQQPFDWYGRGPYRPGVPRPDSLLGHGIGDRHTLFHQQQRVLDQLIAAAPERVRTEVIGATAEGRSMRLLIISSPANLARLDAIRVALDRLADPRTTDAAAATAIARETPAVAILSHSIHGNEPAGFESSMMTAYQLLASDEPATRTILDHVVTILNPSMNPDGHERFAAWNNSVAVASEEPAALEQSEPWSIMGRGNHYRFDMNRDVLAQSQLETRAVAAAVLRWHPQVFVDLHSTTAQYFFAPPALPVNANLPPASIAWLERFGEGNAAAFDRFGWQYFVRDVFDLYYPGYWDSWPSLNGATGMTYETDGGPELRLRKRDGTVTSFADGIAHHFVASLATLETLAANREARLLDYYHFRAGAMTEAGTSRFRRVVLLPGSDSARTARLVSLLARQGIEVRRAGASFASAAAHDYLAAADQAARRSFPAGSYLVDLAQPQARLARAILEPRSTLDSSFARKQIERFERNRRRGERASREGYEFYDVTAWSLPLAYGVEAYWTEDAPAVPGSLVGPEVVAPRGGVSGRARSAYVWRPGSMESSRLAMRLLLEGFAVGGSLDSLRADGASYPPGTFVARVQRNGPELHERIAALAAEVGAGVVAVQSAFPDRGQVGVGSEAVRPLAAPRVLLAGGDGVAQTTFGSLWFYLERELRIPVTPIGLESLGRVDLSRYSVLIVPDGFAGRMAASLGGGGGAVAAWVRGGGAVIGIGAAAELLGRKEVGLTTVQAVGAAAEAEAKPGARPAADTTAAPGESPLVRSATAPDSTVVESVPGLIARALLDRSHWLGFGYEADLLPVPVSGDLIFQPSKAGDNPVVFSSDAPILSGFSWPGNTDRSLKGAAWAVVENVGAGRVVLFAEDPLFRAFWRGTAPLLDNALLFGPRPR